MSLRTTLSTLAAGFASDVIAAIRSAQLEEISQEFTNGHANGHAKHTNGASTSPAAKAAATRKAGKAAGGRLVRRSEDEIAAVADRIAALLLKNPQGMRSEQIRDALNLDIKEMPRPLKFGLDKKLFKCTGHRRATTYFAASAKTSKSKSSKKTAPKPASKASSAKKASAKKAAAKAAKTKAAKKASAKPAAAAEASAST